MKDPHTYLSKLKKRYRRLFRFDQWVCVIYGLTALPPLWALFAIDSFKIFHGTGFVAISTVAVIGYIGSKRLRQNEEKGLIIGYATTALMALSRLAFVFWGGIVSQRAWHEKWKDVLGPDRYTEEFEADIGSALLFLVSPFIFYVLFFWGFYRLIYHISAHWYVKLFIKGLSNQALDSIGTSSAGPDRVS